MQQVRFRAAAARMLGACAAAPAGPTLGDIDGYLPDWKHILSILSRRPAPRNFTRKLRMISGLYLLGYVTCHLLNLGLGVISVDLMDQARPYLSGLWTEGMLGYVMLCALLVHYLIGLWAIFTRPSISGTSQDIVQALSGLAVLPLLATHAVGVAMLQRSGVAVDYVFINRIFWLSNPGIGLTQVVLLSVVWVHGCAGLFLWLRSKPSATGILSCLYPLAVAVPVLALLGFAQAGRIVLADGALPEVIRDPAFIDPIPYQFIKTLTDGVIWVSLALAALVLGGRALRRWISQTASVSITTQDVGQIMVQTGQTLLDGLRKADQPHANLCSGRGRCGTCAVRILAVDGDPLPLATPMEQMTLARINKGDDLRLACQFPLERGTDLVVARVFAPDFSFDAPHDAPHDPDHPHPQPQPDEVTA